jgi:hypothetical protein
MRPSIDWKTLAVTAQDPLEFAKGLQTALQELTDNGYNIVSQVARGEAVIITGQRVMVGAVQSFENSVAQGARRALPTRAPAPVHGVAREEVLYHFTDNKKEKQLAFPTMVEALRIVEKHLNDASGAFAPISLVVVTMTQYDLPSFVGLLRAHEVALREDKPLG